jgi:mannose-6-phosphate isomerase-like protein (cupin superfamily)
MLLERQASPMHPLAAYQRAPSLAASVWYMGSLVTLLADSRDTGGAFSLIEISMKPGNEPPPHVHEREDELFYVLDGAADAYVGEEIFHLAAGGCMFLPRMKPHGFIIRTLRFRMLVLIQPGGLEQYFAAMSASPAYELDLPREAATYSAAETQRAARIGSEYGIRFLSSDQIAKQMPSYFAALDNIAADYPALSRHRGSPSSP